MQLNTDSWPIPDIPEQQLVDFDLFNIEPINGDLHAGFHAFQQGEDILYTPLNGGHWVPTSADLIEAISLEAELFSNRGVALSRHDDTPLKPGTLDRPEHTPYRTLLTPEFGPANIKNFEEKARKLTRDLIDKVIDKGECDFQKAVGEPLPVHNFLSLINLPNEDTELLMTHGQVITRSADPDAVQHSFMAGLQYVGEKLLERKENPTDDFIGHMAVAKLGDEPMSHEDRCNTVFNVILGGIDTTGSSMGFAMNFLARNPEHRRQIANNPEIIPDAIEELFRRHGILNPARLVTRDCEFQGIQFRERDLILLSPALANMDERRFAAPLTADFNRKDKRHFTFSKGLHRCLGLHFARLQMRILFEEWFDRIPDFSLSAGGEVKVGSGRSNTVYELPLVW